jgi:hypothetical protein
MIARRVPHSLIATTAMQGSNVNIDSNGVLTASGVWAVVNTPATLSTLATSASSLLLLSYDFGFTPPVSIGDFVWVDTNGNGLQDANEPGVANVQITVARVSDKTIVGAITTNATGNYNYTAGLQPNTQYSVSINLATSPLVGVYQATKPNAGQVGLSSIGIYNPSTQLIAGTCTTGNLGSANPTCDFGLVPQFNLGLFVWKDIQNATGQATPDGVYQGGEPLIAGVTVRLRGACVHACLMCARGRLSCGHRPCRR